MRGARGVQHEHEYQTSLVWEGNLGVGTAEYSGYDRSYRIRVAGKPDLLGSADPAFRGAEDRYNPEDLLVASLSACHMLSYLALCARRRISVVEYRDQARAVMKTTADGGGRFESVSLNPRMSISDPSREEEALELHEEAHRLCFIANSCNFPVFHKPEFLRG